MKNNFIKIKKEDSDMIFRKVLKDKDVSCLECVKILSQAISILTAEFMLAKNFTDTEYLDYMEKTYSRETIAPPLLALSIILDFEDAIIKKSKEDNDPKS